MKRERYLKAIEDQFRIHSVCGLLGPRQVGKTTLAEMFITERFGGGVIFFDLENPIDLSRLENPMLALSQIQEPIVVIDEIQLRPDLFKILRVIVDSKNTKSKFLILGSASRDLIRQSSETLAGRIGYVELPPFSLFEVDDASKLLLRGGFPRSYLADQEKDSYSWRQSYISTFLERDIPNLGFNVPALQMRRFWMMLTHYHGQILNISEIARSLMISDKIVKYYLDIFVGTFMVRYLSPWTENISKRQVKSPKIYFRDSGILNTLLGITDNEQLGFNPRLGAIWEGFAIEQIIRYLGAAQEELFFWATHADAELDLLVMKDGRRVGFEFKYTDAPKTTKSMHIAMTDLKLDELFIIYPGDKKFLIAEKITVCGLELFVKLQG